MADITETLLDYCDCDGHGCEPCYAAEVIRRLRAAGDEMVDAAARQQWSRLDVAVAAWQGARRG